ncbi:SMP-30/gluconolactonase/LRE family protein [Tenggerimyces flavus]|uniref:SMP-30/gluconolactonase/LRE family protein n=1 Tax=Tenggerimyces flavus TaxID=1708749 RepID=A0ABV7Y9Y7_9ACTN|nr:SMP-30/gluconolactonase/LRE family protein [Tenggerimyces flavus]MBM7785399.1 gluconolactonase [Tenggerimyces flavus]
MAKDDVYETLEDDFGPCTWGDLTLEKVYEGCRWAEGGVYVPSGKYLLWSDIPNDRILRYDEASGAVGVWRHPAGYTNGHTLDREGRLISCEHGNRRVTRTEHDGSITVLADAYDGMRLNSPNDVVVKSDDSIWFTDPSYGIQSDYEGFYAESEIGACHVYRIDADSGDLTIVGDDFDRPNGIAFTPDESKLFVSDTGKPKNMRVFDVTSEGKLEGGEVFAVCTNGAFDGFRFDSTGRLWTSAGDGVHCYSPDGRLIGKIKVPEAVANVVFGGPKRNRMFICGSTSLYSVVLSVRGAPLPFDPRES